MIDCNPDFSESLGSTNQGCHSAEYYINPRVVGGSCPAGQQGCWVWNAFAMDYLWTCTATGTQPAWCADTPNGCDWNPCECWWEAIRDATPECDEELSCCWLARDGFGLTFECITQREPAEPGRWGCTYYSELPPAPATCPSGYSWNALHYDCVRDDLIKDCPAGYTWSDDYLGCRQNVAPYALRCEDSGFYYDVTTNTCLSYTGGGKLICRANCWDAGSTGYISHFASDITFPVWNDNLGQCICPIHGLECFGVCGNQTLYPGPHAWDTATCGCLPYGDCPAGECWCESSYGGGCITCVMPDCGAELNCEWDPVTCDWLCDDPCPTSGVFDYDLCYCVDANAKDVDATFDHSELRYVEFRHAGDTTPNLAIHTYVLNGAVTPVQWTEDNVVEVIPSGDSPAIIRLRSGLVRLAYVDTIAGAAKTSIWDLTQGERYVQTIAAGALEVNVIEDKWGRLVCPVYISGDDWYVTVGQVNTDGTTYTFSTPVKMVDASSNPMGGVNAQCSIKLTSDGGFIFSYIDSAGDSIRRRCRALTNAGVGAWV